MQYLCVSVFHQTMAHTTGSVSCLHSLLMHVYPHVFAFIYAVRLNGSLFHGGGGGLGTPCFFLFFLFFLILEGSWGFLLGNLRSNTV